MKTTMTAVALVLALSSSAFAQEVKQPATSAAPAATITAPAAKPVLAPETMQKVGAPTAPATVIAPKVEAKPSVAPATATAPVKTAAPAATTKLININSVAISDLEKLPKIGEARAKQIVAGRPYKSVDDLMAKKILPQDVFDAVKGMISIQ